MSFSTSTQNAMFRNIILSAIQSRIRKKWENNWESRICNQFFLKNYSQHRFEFVECKSNSKVWSFFTLENLPLEPDSHSNRYFDVSAIEITVKTTTDQMNSFIFRFENPVDNNKNNCFNWPQKCYLDLCVFRKRCWNVIKTLLKRWWCGTVPDTCKRATFLFDCTRSILSSINSINVVVVVAKRCWFNCIW